MADPILKMSKDIKNMQRYTFLNDSILSLIERSENEEMKEARRLLRRLRERDIYKFADQTLLPPEFFDAISEDTISSARIFEHCTQSDLEETDIIVQWLTLNYAMKDKNPIDSVSFYTKYDSIKTVSIFKGILIFSRFLSVKSSCLDLSPSATRRLLFACIPKRLI